MAYSERQKELHFLDWLKKRGNIALLKANLTSQQKSAILALVKADMETKQDSDEALGSAGITELAARRSNLNSFNNL